MVQILIFIYTAIFKFLFLEYRYRIWFNFTGNKYLLSYSNHFIAAINFVLIIFLIKSKGVYSYLIAILIGGSLGNLFDRIYYYAVPDFIDIHFGNFHWFIFNVADIFITLSIIGLMIVELSKKEKISSKHAQN